MIVNNKIIITLCFVGSLLVVALIHFYEIKLIKDKFQAKYDAYKEQLLYLKPRIIEKRKNKDNIVKYIKSSSLILAKYNKDSRFPLIVVRIGETFFDKFGNINLNSSERNDIMLQETIGSDTDIMIVQNADDFLEKEQPQCFMDVSMSLGDRQYRACKQFSVYYLIPIINLLVLMPVIALMNRTKAYLLKELKNEKNKIRNTNSLISRINNLFYQAEVIGLENVWQASFIDYDTMSQIINCFDNKIKSKKLEIKYSMEEQVKKMLVNKLLFQRIILALIEDAVNHIQDRGAIEISVLCEEDSILVKYEDNRYLVDEEKGRRIDLLKKELNFIEIRNAIEGVIYEILIDSKKNEITS